MNSDCIIIAGHCSTDQSNRNQAFEISKIPGLAGQRIVAKKSRTAFDPTGKGMGMDFAASQRNQKKYYAGAPSSEFEMLPSIELAYKIHEETGIFIATEIMSPALQLPLYARKFTNGGLFIWNPSANQLGFPLQEMAHMANEHNWNVGIKNGKWLGVNLSELESQPSTSIEITWKGLATYCDPLNKERIKFIQRGVDVPGKGRHRNAPIHHSAQRVSLETGIDVYFDPSHSLGPDMRDHIVSASIEAMKMKRPDGKYLYAGLLIEVGDSITDTGQHITIDELKQIIDEVSNFRNLVTP